MRDKELDDLVASIIPTRIRARSQSGKLLPPALVFDAKGLRKLLELAAEIGARHAQPPKVLLCVAGPCCMSPALEGFLYCASHKCETVGCAERRDRAFHHCARRPS